AAGYLLWMYGRVMFVKLNTEKYAAALTDLRAYEVVYLLPLLALAIWVGMYPDTWLNFLHPSISHILTATGGTAGLASR
ncbi:MAG: NADH-quinone oxidoreductase subunit M, partial [Chloroflexi bacterium]|nr:NADH-quinone oxidoreductase subunit M [Chloroflexota bacterium]